MANKKGQKQLIESVVLNIYSNNTIQMLSGTPQKSKTISLVKFCKNLKAQAKDIPDNDEDIIVFLNKLGYEYIFQEKSVKEKKETKYSKTKFDGFTHRFIVEFNVAGQPNTSTLHIYSNSDNYQELDNFINEKKSEKVTSFKTVHRASKEQDEMDSVFEYFR